MTLAKEHAHNNKKAFSLITHSALIMLFALCTTNIVYAQNQYDPESGNAAYIAKINELNPDLTKKQVSGLASFIVKNDQLYITIMVKGLSPSMTHLLHIHGFKGSTKKATCPGTDADTNGDGVVDLIETHPYTGVTLIPFNAAPADLKILSSSYPVANKKGLLTYHMSVPLDSLETAIQNEYGIDKLSLENRVIYIHGVPKDPSLPETVQSLPDVPAHVTVPVACGEIEAFTKSH